jgi:phosphoenolpyruvate synthase/pyruvate phosphate dikinase
LHETEPHKSAFSGRVLEFPLRETERTYVYSNNHLAKNKKMEDIQRSFYGNLKYVDILLLRVSKIHCAKYISTLHVNGSITLNGY